MRQRNTGINTAHYIFMACLFLGILSAMKTLTYLIAALILDNYPFDTLLATTVILYLTIMLIIIMYLLIGKSKKFFKAWIYAYGFYIVLGLISDLVILSNIEESIVNMGQRFLLYTFWTLVFIFSKSFDEDTYGIKVSDKLANKIKRFSINIWS